MSIYQLKSRFQDLLRPISNTLVKQGISANQVTLSAIALSGGMAYLVASQGKQKPCVWYVLPAGLFVRMAMNAIDGMMAKEHGQASTLGAWLNEVGDIVSDTMLFASLLPHAKGQRLAVGSLIVLSNVSELVAIASSVMTGERANHGPLGKSDRAFALGVLGLAVGMGYRPTSTHKRLMVHTAQILLAKTIYNRAKHIIKPTNPTSSTKQLPTS